MTPPGAEIVNGAATTTTGLPSRLGISDAADTAAGWTALTSGIGQLEKRCT